MLNSQLIHILHPVIFLDKAVFCKGSPAETHQEVHGEVGDEDKVDHGEDDDGHKVIPIARDIVPNVLDHRNNVDYDDDDREKDDDDLVEDPVGKLSHDEFARGETKSRKNGEWQLN